MFLVEGVFCARVRLRLVLVSAVVLIDVDGDSLAACVLHLGLLLLVTHSKDIRLGFIGGLRDSLAERLRDRPSFLVLVKTGRPRPRC